MRVHLVLTGLLLIALPLTLHAADAAKRHNCKTIHGTYAHWDGHPPYERVKADDGKMYGLISSFEPDSDLQVPNYPLPESIKQVWDANEDVDGEFVYCFAKDTAKFKEYEIEPVELGWIKSFKPTDAGETATFIRKLKIAAIEAANRIDGSYAFSTAQVSFDFLDGVISDVEIGQSGGHDAEVLNAITHANYPVTPNSLRGKKLHVQLSIYFPAQALEEVTTPD